MRRISVHFAAAVLLLAALSLRAQTPNSGAHMKGAFRRPAQNGWVFVHLEGAPFDLGYQHGYLLFREIEDAEKVVVLEQTHGGRHDWNFFRDAAKDMMWPQI